MLFVGSAGHPAAAEALALVQRHRPLFDDENACFFGVTVDPADVREERIAPSLPGIRWFLDFDRAVSAQYGAIEGESEGARYAAHWLLLDPMLRVRYRASLEDGERFMAACARHMREDDLPSTAPVLVIPNVLAPELCRHLIDRYEENGGTESGFMRDVDGKTVCIVDHSHKRRVDYVIEDEPLLAILKARMAEIVRPLIKHAFQFEATRVERWIVACYDGNDGGHFRPHRDNTTRGTAHRKFACTLNLNAEEYDGGDLRFPEFGSRTYRAPTGGAVIFSCSLLHEARPVTRGRRYALLPFFYDDDGARIREANLAFVTPDLQDYRSGLPQRPDDRE
jgi:predicted 2-oxoglutarate/Fe(II)-dependent dioxygenase YbiX